MPDWDLVGRQHVLAAIAEWDRSGSADFLGRYRFPRAKAVTLWHGGEEYDPNALLGVAYLHATGHATASSDIDDASTAQVLRVLGFDVVVDEDTLATAKPRVRKSAPAEPRVRKSASTSGTSRTAGTAGTSRRTPVAAAPVKVCPTCYMAIPATGICDNCD